MWVPGVKRPEGLEDGNKIPAYSVPSFNEIVRATLESTKTKLSAEWNLALELGIHLYNALL